TFASHIGSLGENFHDSLDGAFKFHEFFRVYKDDEGNDMAKFVHESMVKNFLDLLVNDTLQNKFPYATEEYRNYNNHSLWLLPNRVKVIEAMEKLLKDHQIFGSNEFGIVNISGNNHDDEEDKDAKNRVNSAIKNHEYTITLTGQRLTTGASIPEWTAVFMMSDTNSATTYLQTAFRCQTPAKKDGKLKTQGYVFDFAPDRTLKLIAEAIELNHKSGKTNSPEQKDAMRQFLNFCPILAAKGGTMKPYDVEKMLSQLKKAIIERVSRNGFDDPKLYNDELLQLDEMDITRFNELRAIIGTSTSERTNEIEINNLGMDNLEAEKAEEAERKNKQKKELTEEEKEALRKLKEARKQKQTAISILRAVSIRMPMLVYGANASIREDITLEKFIELVDEESWQEFMPMGLSKEQFREFTKYYDEDVFKGVAHSIRAKAFDCDDLLPTERIRAIAEIFGTFKNPDKETVLTPWNVVNMHMTKAFGGHDFNSGVVDKTGKPEWKSLDVDTSVWTQDDAKILEINSKSGLYPLLACYNVYTRQLKQHKKPEDRISREVWNKVLADNIYVLCKSPMAKSITLRTLAGYSGAKANIVYMEDLVKKLQRKDNFGDYNLRDELLGKFNLKDKNMKFTAVVGNPPYQIDVKGNTRSAPIYNHFIEAAHQISDLVCLIHPARFLFNAGQTPKEWNKKMLNDSHLSVIFYEQNSANLFPNIDIKGGVCITLWDRSKNHGGLGGKFRPIQELDSILSKVNAGGFEKIVYVNTAPAYPLNPKRPNDKKIRSNAFSELPEIFRNKADKNHTIKIIGVINNARTEKFISEKLIDDQVLKKWKVFLPESNGGGKLGEVLSTPFVAKPNVGCAQTFVQIGSFTNELEADNCIKYIKTKFCRALLGTLKVTQHNPKNVWKNIPLQDFSKKSDINWSKSISEIDKQLYTKYGLNKKEIDFIETHIKPMV
ncbi:MAG: Eco57I restriction-modification methylase domain-containing protein, partial [Dysgonamonadaceae bacterium]|nr:Eco57I restriction-modification methylase domain-containing protein [Dysgonamonadaceae bacterium]